MSQVPCARCGKPVEDVDASEVAEVASIFKRALVICSSCEGVPAAQSHDAPARPLPAWPDGWSPRAIKDLDIFAGRPLEKAQSLWKYIQASGTIAIIGDRGRGKTVMATWFANERRRRHQNPGTYLRVHDLFATIRRSWHPQSKDDEWAVLERYRLAPLLVIDEFQERSESDWENRTLVNILDHRHANMLPTVLIANLTKEEFLKQAGPSVGSRVAQTGGVANCDWKDLRTGQDLA